MKILSNAVVVVCLSGALAWAAPSPTEKKEVARYKFNTNLGWHWLHGSGVSTQAQLGLATNPEAPFYIGPEFHYTLFSPGSLLSLMMSGWYEYRVRGIPRLLLGVGGSTGLAFCSGRPGISTTTYAVYLDTWIGQQADDLVAAKVQFRPGIVGGTFSFLTSFSISFRFY